MPITRTAPPPKRATPNKPTSAKPSLGQAKVAARAEGLQGLFQVAGVICLTRGAYADAAAIGQHSPPICMEAAKLGQQNETIGKLLDYLTDVGPYSGLIMAVMPLVLQIMANHKKIDGANLSAFGVVPPQLLEAKARQEAAELAQQAIRAQREAQKATEALQAQLNSEAA